MYDCFSLGRGAFIFVSHSDYFIIFFTKNCWLYYLQISKAKKGKDKSHTARLFFPLISKSTLQVNQIFIF